MNKLFGLVCAIALLASTAWAETLRDPTQPLGYQVTKPSGPELVLQAIFERRSGRQAIVNGQSVKAGGTVAGARIKSITPHGIVYSYRGQTHTLRLRPQVINN